MTAKRTVKRKQSAQVREARAGAPQTPPARASAKAAAKQPVAKGKARAKILTDKVSKAVKTAAKPPPRKPSPKKPPARRVKAAATPVKVKGKANTRAAEPKDPGRHSAYSSQLRDKICDQVASGVSWRAIEKAGVATQRQLSTWLRTIPEFHEHYARAREARAESIVADIEKQLADLGAEPAFGQLNAARLRIDTLKWQVSCYYPRMYGTKVQVDATVTNQTVAQYDYARLSDSDAKALRVLLAKCRVTADED
jgi:hypothetical protein